MYLVQNVQNHKYKSVNVNSKITKYERIPDTFKYLSLIGVIWFTWLRLKGQNQIEKDQGQVSNEGQRSRTEAKANCKKDIKNTKIF